MNVNRFGRISLVPLFCGLLLPLALAATTIEQMSVEKMSRVAPAIVRATCISNRTAWDAGEIWTFTTFNVRESWRGFAPAQFTVRLLGGTYGNLTSVVAGVPRFSPGEDVVLFLERTARGDFSVVSWEQGTFRVACAAPSGAETVTQGTAAYETFNAAENRFETSGIHNMPLAALRARVQAALRAQSGANQ